MKGHICIKYNSDVSGIVRGEVDGGTKGAFKKFPISGAPGWFRQ